MGLNGFMSTGKVLTFFHGYDETFWENGHEILNPRKFERRMPFFARPVRGSKGWKI